MLSYLHRRHVAKMRSPRHRHTLAVGLRRVLHRAEHPSRSLTTVVPPQRGQVLEARAILVAVADLLDGPDALEPRGIELVDDLLTNGNSSIYAATPPGTLAADLRQARTALLLAERRARRPPCA
jgi:hypothetical protein